MADTPCLRVIRGDATAEEIAALVAVLSAAAAPAAPARASRRPRPVWGDRAAQVRQPFWHGPDAWRRNARRGIV